MAKKKDELDKKSEAARTTTLTEAEWAIMDVVWAEEPCAAGTVQEALQASHNWAYSTVKTTMDRMVAKGLLTTRAIRNLTLYSACISRDEARHGEFKQFLRRAFDGAVAPMLQFLVEQETLSESELQDLRRLIRKSTEKNK